MEILGFGVYIICFLLTLLWVVGIRANTASGQGVAMGTVNTTLLFIVSLILIPAFSLSPFHLIWLFSTSVVLGIFSLTPPFSILSVPGRLLWILVCLGLNTSSMTQKHICGLKRQSDYKNRLQENNVSSQVCLNCKNLQQHPKKLGTWVCNINTKPVLIDEDYASLSKPDNCDHWSVISDNG